MNRFRFLLRVFFMSHCHTQMPIPNQLEDLSRIETWATSWIVLFGAAKCKTITISNRRDAHDTDDSHASFHFFCITLEAENVELLGFTLQRPQRAIVRSQMEYANFAWSELHRHSNGWMQGIQRRTIRIINLPENDRISHQIQPHDTGRAVVAVFNFQSMHYGEAPELLCKLLPEHLQLDPRLGCSVRSYDLAP